MVSGEESFGPVLPILLAQTVATDLVDVNHRRGSGS